MASPYRSRDPAARQSRIKSIEREYCARRSPSVELHVKGTGGPECHGHCKLCGSDPVWTPAEWIMKCVGVSLHPSLCGLERRRLLALPHFWSGLHVWAQSDPFSAFFSSKTRFGVLSMGMSQGPLTARTACIGFRFPAEKSCLFIASFPFFQLTALTKS